MLEELSEYYNSMEIGAMSKKEQFDAWLRVNGIIGFTDEIIEALEELTELNIAGGL